MGLRALKAGPRYAAFRRWRTRARERLRRWGLALDAWTGGWRRRRAARQALLEGQALQLRALAELTERVRALEAALRPGAAEPLPPRPGRPAVEEADELRQ